MTGVIIVSFLVSFIRLLFYCIYFSFLPSFILCYSFIFLLVTGVSMKNCTRLGETLVNEVKTNEFQLTRAEEKRKKKKKEKEKEKEARILISFHSLKGASESWMHIYKHLRERKRGIEREDCYCESD